MSKKDPVCSFCSQSGYDANDLISSPTGAFICRECVTVCQNILNQTVAWQKLMLI